MYWRCHAERRAVPTGSTLDWRRSRTIRFFCWFSFLYVCAAHIWTHRVYTCCFFPNVSISTRHSYGYNGAIAQRRFFFSLFVAVLYCGTAKNTSSHTAMTADKFVLIVSRGFCNANHNECNSFYMHFRQPGPCSRILRFVWFRALAHQFV